MFQLFLFLLPLSVFISSGSTCLGVDDLPAVRSDRPTLSQLSEWAHKRPRTVEEFENRINTIFDHFSTRSPLAGLRSSNKDTRDFYQNPYIAKYIGNAMFNICSVYQFGDDDALLQYMANRILESLCHHGLFEDLAADKKLHGHLMLFLRSISGSHPLGKLHDILMEKAQSSDGTFSEEELHKLLLSNKDVKKVITSRLDPLEIHYKYHSLDHKKRNRLIDIKTEEEWPLSDVTPLVTNTESDPTIPRTPPRKAHRGTKRNRG